MILMAGIFHVLFIMFDYAFHDPDEGAFMKLRDVANETISNETWKERTLDTSNNLRQFFGIARVICIILCPVMFLIAVVRKPGVSE